MRDPSVGPDVASSGPGPLPVGGPGERRTDRAVRWELDSDREAPGMVRTALRDRLAEWDLVGDDVQGALLVATELVTNAVEHAGTRLDVLVTYDGAVLQIAVEDGRAAPPRLRQVDHGAPRGRGLRIVDAIATSWGTVPHTTGKTVWAQVVPDTAWLARS